MKKLFLLACTLLLVGCFGSDPELPTRQALDEARFDVFKTKHFEIQHPKSFKAKKSGNLTIFESEVRDIVFTPNLSVQTLPLNAAVDLDQLSQGILNKCAERLLDFDLLDSSKLQLASGFGSSLMKLSLFKARESVEGELIEFVQAVTVSDKNLFVITASYNFNDNLNVSAQLLQSVKSFFLK